MITGEDQGAWRSLDEGEKEDQTSVAQGQTKWWPKMSADVEGGLHSTHFLFAAGFGIENNTTGTSCAWYSMIFAKFEDV